MLWVALTDMLSVLVVGKRGRVRNPVLLTRTRLIVSSAIYLPLSNVHQYLLLPTKSKKEKREAKRLDNPNPTDDSSFVDPASVSVIGVVGDSTTSQSPSLPPEKKPNKEKPPTKAKKSASDDRISVLDQKWSERFSRLEALLLAKSREPTFSSDVRVTPIHSPPKDTF